MGYEIERKFLITDPPLNHQESASDKILQGYIIEGSDKSILRVRKKGDKFYQTIKKSGGLSRQEVEIELNQAQFDALWPLTEKQRIEKTRYYLDYDEHTIELDIFEGKLDGLIMAEVEFEDENVVNKFHPPDWFGEEVTEDNRYKNNNLAKKGIPDQPHS